jgi:hypothetical protein
LKRRTFAAAGVTTIRARRVRWRVDPGRRAQTSEVEQVGLAVDHLVGGVGASSERRRRVAVRGAVPCVVVDVREQDRAVRRAPGVFVGVFTRVVERDDTVAVGVGSQIDDRRLCRAARRLAVAVFVRSGRAVLDLRHDLPLARPVARAEGVAAPRPALASRPTFSVPWGPS